MASNERFIKAPSSLKKELLRQALSYGANIVMIFKYGQKKHKWWQLMFAFKCDTESSFSEGAVIKL
jgi:hypothetical protein